MNDIEILKKLAGVHEYQPAMNEKEMIENASFTATELKQKERALGVKPGDPEWFDLWFGKDGLRATRGFRGLRK